jgi:hypothetical protein
VDTDQVAAADHCQALIPGGLEEGREPGITPDKATISGTGLGATSGERELIGSHVDVSAISPITHGGEARRGKALLQWMNGSDVRSYFYGGQVVAPRDETEFISLWKRARQTAPPPPLHSGGAGLGPLPESVATRGDKLKAGRVFRDSYELFGADNLVEVRLDGQLITPQVWVDEQYVDELIPSLPADGDDLGLWDFCFPIGQVGSPSLTGNGGAFISDRRGIAGLTPVRVVRTEGDRMTLGFDVVSRPNWMSLAVVVCPGLGPRVLIRNGVHRLLALLRAGRPRAFAVIQRGGIGDVGLDFNDSAIFKPDRLCAPRAPLLSDYVDPVAGTPVSVFATHQIFRFAIVGEMMLAPSQPVAHQ